jgi:hypothetical protein
MAPHTILRKKKFKIVPSAGSLMATAFSDEEVIFLVM